MPQLSLCVTNRIFLCLLLNSILSQQRWEDEQSWHPLGEHELVEAARWWGCEWVIAPGLSVVMDYYPLWDGVMKWLFIKAKSTCHQTLPGPLRPHRQIRHPRRRRSTAWLAASPSLSPLLCVPHRHSPVSFPEPIPFQCRLLLPAAIHNLNSWCTLLKIRCQSYLSSGTIATVQAQLRTAAWRKNSSAPTSLRDPLQPTASAKQPVTASH